ncbi:glycosyltransferase [Arenibaculum pallidiluteum]|uniref:glycosyltransferase n=1 Tax=Arenibaculum pallidiluteum TaxID=2812559 RepID=UPI001A97A6A8|nr:glycosyltransferase [Arenibaculum pallidiluteum]
MAVPFVLHQLWKDEYLPDRYIRMQDTWRLFNPGLQIVTWTDGDLASFIGREFPDLLELYHSYQENICRADLGRYLVLRHFGGIYADLDCECLKPIGSLIEGRRFVIGLEPRSHSALEKAVQRGLRDLPCPSFIATEPGHPIWNHILAEVQRARHEPDPLDATGPFLLARALAGHPDAASLTLAPPELVSPLDKNECWDGRVHDIEHWERSTRDAYVLHHWDGTWFRNAPEPFGLPAGVPVQVVGATGPAELPPGKPRISCLMVTRGRTALAKAAIDSFLRQTYPDKELVIVSEEEDPELLDHVRSKPGNLIKVVLVRGGTPTLGELRNVAVEQASGPLVCQWDDDDLYDPRRLEVQHAVLARTKAHACMLQRWMVWWPGQERLAVSSRRTWEGSLLCLKSAMTRYPGLRRGEDTPVVDHLLATARVALFDLPRLYVYRVHGANTFGPDHFEVHWATATARFQDARCRAVLAEMSKRIPEIPAAQASEAAAPRACGSPALRGDAEPDILVLTPVKDARRHLDRYVGLLSGLDHDPRRIAVAFLEGDSRDGTHDDLAARLPDMRRRFGRVELHKRDFGFRHAGPRWDVQIQRRRREVLARSRNRLLSRALRNEAWVLWLDADLLDYPPDLLSRLLGAGKDIVVPHCTLPDGRTFDLNTFRLARGPGVPEDDAHLVDGIFQPPRGVGRLYLDAFRDEPLVQVDAVGGTALLVRADLHREGLVFPPASYRGYIETEGLAAMARDMGYSCWALPGLDIVHSPE